MTDSSTFRTGFVCLVGPTNAGKSTLMNALVGEKIAIISPKPQTTRNRLLGIVFREGRGQIIFVDTPGLHQPRAKLGQRMVDLALSSLSEADLSLLVVDATLDAAAGDGLSPANEEAMGRVMSVKLPLVVALNKVDEVADKSRLLPVLARYAEKLPGAELIPVSALRHDGLERLEAAVLSRLPEGPPLYPADTLSDQAERFLAGEVIREKLIMATRQEVPFSLAVVIEAWEEPQAEGKALKLSAVVHVERESQKGIVIGKGGRVLKDVGTKARLELEKMFGVKVFLSLFVRVEENWTNDPRRLAKLGY
jgi:GTP-binding protein Era